MYACPRLATRVFLLLLLGNAIALTTSTTTTPPSTGSVSTTSPATSVPPTSSSATFLAANTTLPLNLTCPKPRPPQEGAVISSGPYYANRTLAVFTCFVGYNLKGPSDVLCSVNGTWDTDFPQCIPIQNNPHVNNNITVEDKNGVPWWLIIVMCVTFGCLCLLLLTCTVVYCLKMGGCLTRDGCRCLCCRQRVTDTEQGVMFQDQEQAYCPSPNEPSSRKVSQVTIRPTRKEAKLPDNVWMPHSNNIRPYNTSTK